MKSTYSSPFSSLHSHPSKINWDKLCGHINALRIILGDQNIIVILKRKPEGLGGLRHPFIS